MYFAYAPMGQRRVEPDAAAVAALKREWKLKKVPSFEVWCAATCYDPTKAFGGELFQAMMFWTLVDSKAQKLNLDGAVHYTRKNRDGYPDHAEKGNEYKHKGRASKNYAPKTQGKTNVKTYTGGAIASGGETEQGFQRWGKSIPDLVVPTAVYPHGKLHWWESAGMGYFQSMPAGNEKCGVRSNTGRSFYAQKVPSEGTSDDAAKITQSHGCISFGNRLAAYYGLYFYPDCEKDERNWYYTIGNYTVRMRVPNPAYTIEGDRLFVYEEEHGGGDIADGFEFPQMPAPKIPWDSLAEWKSGEDQVKTVLAPWAGTSNDDASAIAWREHLRSSGQLDYWVNFITEKEVTFKDRMHERENFGFEQAGGLAFGWSYPRALWLYPHDGPNPEEWTEGNLAGWKDKFPGYQQWPTWREALTWESWSLESTKMKNPDNPLITVLELYPAERRDWAMNGQRTVQRKTANTAAGLTSTEVVQVQATTARRVEQAPAQEAVTQERQTDAIDASVQIQPNQGPEAEIATKLALEAGDDSEPGFIDSYLDSIGDLNGMDERPRILGKTPEDRAKSALKRGGWENKALAKVQDRQTLEPGSAKRANDENDHFFSLEHSPWAPRDLSLIHI